MSAPRSIAIVGATGGLGRALALRLHAHQERVVLGGRDEPALQALASEIGAESFRVDATDFTAMDAFVDRAAGREGLDGIVNCAGSLFLKPAHRTTRDEFERTMASNLTTAFATVRSAARVMRQRGGSIVLVSSAAATVGLQNHEAIAAAKAGVAGLTRSAAATYATHGIRVNAIAPGLTESPMTSKLLATPAARDTSLALHPTGRAGRPEELASLVEWLLGPEATWVTGQIWGIDGGLGSIKTRPVKRLSANPPQSKKETA